MSSTCTHSSPPCAHCRIAALEQENTRLKVGLTECRGYDCCPLAPKLTRYEAAIDAVVKAGNQPTRSNHPTYVKIPVDDFDALKALREVDDE